MSMIRICDCGCHFADEMAEPKDFDVEEFTTFADLDICAQCLAGRPGCRRWLPWATNTYSQKTESGIDQVLRQYYDDVIKGSLRGPLFKIDYDAANRFTITP